MTQMRSTYRAVQAVSKGKLEMVEKPLLSPPAGHVRIRVEACGVCHSDSGTVEAVFPIQWPRVPGHEAVGRIDALGDGVEGWKIGQRVGVGFLGGNCGYCQPCRRGDLVSCQNQEFTGIQHDGGYAEVMIAKASGLISVPDALSSADAAPLLCAGLTTFSALRDSPAKAGDLVAVLGIGGLGHLGVQWANKFGYRVAAVGRGPENGDLARKLGAHIYIDSKNSDAAAELQKLGGAKVILATAPNSKSMSDLFPGLGRNGSMVVGGAGMGNIEVAPFTLLLGKRRLQGWSSGTAADSEDTMRFATLTGVRPMIEKFPLEKAAEAYERMNSGHAQFRVVLTM